MGSGRSGLYNGTRGSRNRLPKNSAQIKHFMRKDVGHLVDNPKNRATLLRVSNDESLYAGTDKWGNKWYIETCKNGGQHWVRVMNGIINEGGYNRSPIEWDSETGLNKNPRKGSMKK